MTRFFAFALLAVAACGAEIEPTSNASNGTPSDTADTKKEPERAGNGAEPAPSPAPEAVVGPLVKIKNTSSATRWIVVDAQSTPVEFEVGDPPLQLNGYGAYWCGGPTTNHNDPFNRVAKLEAGKVADVYWRAISVTWNDGCWSGTPLVGSYPTKACFYESDPMTTENAPKTCVDVTLTIASSGETILDL